MAGVPATSRRGRARAPALALIGLAALGGLPAAPPCFDAASPQVPETQLRSGEPAVAQVQPKRPMSSYMLWMNDNRDRLQNDLGTKNIGTIGKEAGRQWREIGDEVKSEYEERAAELKREYEAELQKFLAAGGVVSKKSKAKKDPNAPKKPLTTYMRWLQDNRQQIVASLPEGQQGVAAVAKAAGVQWKTVSEDEKRKYQDLVDAAKVEYQKQLEEYKARAA